MANKPIEMSSFSDAGHQPGRRAHRDPHGPLEDTTRDRPVIVYSDSAYRSGLLTQAWKAQGNVELVEKLRGCAASSRSAGRKVAGHAGIPPKREH